MFFDDWEDGGVGDGIMTGVVGGGGGIMTGVVGGGGCCTSSCKKKNVN